MKLFFSCEPTNIICLIFSFWYCRMGSFTDAACSSFWPAATTAKAVDGCYIRKMKKKKKNCKRYTLHVNTAMRGPVYNRVCVYLSKWEREKKRERVNCRLLPHWFSRVCGTFVRQSPFWGFPSLFFLFFLRTSVLQWLREKGAVISHLTKCHLGCHAPLAFPQRFVS